MTTVFVINHVDESYAIVQRMKEGLAESSSRELLLRGIDLNEEVTPYLKELIGSRVWDSIEISDCRGKVNVGVAHALSQDGVKSLKLNGENVQECFHELGNNKSLEYVRVTTNWTANNVESLSKGVHQNQHLQTLDFRWSSFEGLAVQTLAKGLRQNSKIRDLHFSGCGLEDEHVTTLVSALRYHPTLECLDLNGNKCKSLPIPPKSSSLKCLDLRSQKIPRTGRLDVTALADALRSNTSLKCVKLSENNLTDDDAEKLAFALSENTSLEELYLARNKITDQGIIKLAEQFPKQKCLRKLSLWGNPFGEAGAKALLEGLQHNVELEDLELFQKFSVSSMIMHNLLTNRAGKKILQSEPNDIPLALWPLVLERVNNISFPKRSNSTARVDALFYMVRGPVLFARGEDQ
jgi:hypothetical protein